MQTTNPYVPPQDAGVRKVSPSPNRSGFGFPVSAQKVESPVSCFRHVGDTTMLAKHLGKMTFYCIVYKNPLKRNGLSGFVAVSPSEVPRIPAPRSLSCGARLNSLNSWSKLANLLQIQICGISCSKMDRSLGPAALPTWTTSLCSTFSSDLC